MKRKTKIKIYILCVMFIGLFIISNQSQKAYAVDNYSNYLFNQEITIVNDRALIFQETASGTNNYRNYFESNFLFPAKLSSEMFNAYANDYTQYSLSQIYLDNLDNEYTFNSNNNSENIETNQNINIEQNDLINGTLLDNEYPLYKNFKSNPNENIQNSWTYNGAGQWQSVDDYPDTSIYDCIQAVALILYGYNFSYNEQIFGFENTDIFNYIIYRIDVMLYVEKYYGTISQEFKIALYNNTSWSSFVQIPITSDMVNHSISFTNLYLDQSDINDLRLNLKAPRLKVYDTLVHIPSIQLKLYGIYNGSIINSDGVIGIGGTYDAEYTFTDDDDGGNPTDWTLDEGGGTINVINEKESHSKVVELHDTSSGAFIRMYNTFNEQEIGTIEFWLFKDVNNKRFDIMVYDGSDLAIWLVFHSDTYMKYFDGSWHNIENYLYNQWIHVRIDFDCNDDWHLWINQISKDSGSGYGYYITPTTDIDKIQFSTEISDLNYYTYLDAIDYSWSEGYFLNRNLYATLSKIYLEKEIIIDYLETDIYKPVYLDLYTEMCLNKSTNIYIYLYNYDIENNFTIFNINDVYDYNLQYFRFNETGQFRLNKFKIFIDIEYVLNFSLYINNFYLKITYIKQNTLGYHDVSIKWNKEKDDTSLIGYNLFRIKIFNNFFQYYYIEYNIFTSNYIINWQIIEFNNTIETFELDCHIRYGLNTLDVEITNVLIDVYLNSINVLSFIEQDRKYFNGKHYKPEFNYTTHTRNYLNLTGIIGNYSYNTLAGIRCLSGSNDYIYNRFFTVPLFKQSIEVSQRVVAQGDVEIENEPNPPKNANYWTYTSFRLIAGSTFQTGVGNWSINYTPLEVEQYEAKYYYNPEIIRHGSWGDWTVRFGNLFKIDFNFFQNFLIDILNLIFLFFQYLFYLVVASISFIFMFLGCYIIAFLYNVCLYYIFIALIYVLWFLWELLLWLWSIIIWIWSNIIYPFLEWCYQVLLPMIIEAIIIIIAFMLTCFVFVITLGQIDFWVLYAQIYDILWIIVNFIIEWFLIFAQNYDALLMFFVLYLIDIGLIYSNYIYSRARGFMKRAERMYYTFELFIIPIVFIWNILCKLLEGTPEL